MPHTDVAESGNPTVKRPYSWRLALRIARRDAQRAKARSLLVIAMIALPITGVTAIDLASRSSDLSAAEQQHRDLGQADALFKDAGGGMSILQTPDAESVTIVEPDEGEGAELIEREGTAWEDLQPLLPPGAEAYPDSALTLPVRTGEGVLWADVRELDTTQSFLPGLLTVTGGTLPQAAGEIAATDAFLDETGLSIGATVRISELDDKFKITASYELPGSLNLPELLTPPGSVFDPLGEESYPNWLVTAPDGIGWDTVLAANEQGFSVSSRAVLNNPPPDADVPYYQDMFPDEQGVDSTIVTALVTMVALVILEICLLAGPAFAVGARRSRRQLGLIGANGADRRQLRAVMLASGIVLGAVAAVIGVALGLVLAFAGRPWIEAANGARFGAWDFRPWELATIAALGVTIGLLAAVVPAVTAARSSVLDSLTGRRGVRRTSRKLPLIGTVTLLSGLALALVGGLTLDSTVVVAAGAVLAELGLVALTPLLVGVFGRLARFMPLSGRLALRDATRNRGRTAPAVAAVLAAVAGTVAVATTVVSGDAKAEARYEQELPLGSLVIAANQFEALPQLDPAREAAQRELPTAEQIDVGRIVPGAKDCGPYPEEDGCGALVLTIPTESECPLWTEESESLTEAERQDLNSDPRCTSAVGDSFLADWSDVIIGGPELLTAMGVSDQEAARALERGDAVVFKEHYLDSEGQVSFARYDELVPGTTYDSALDGEEELIPDETLRWDGYVVEPRYGLGVVLSPQAARDEGLTVADHASLFTMAEEPTAQQRQAFDGVVNEFMFPPMAFFEDGHVSDIGVTLLILALFATVITLGAAGIATGLAQADSEADLATLAAVGAPPRVRRTLSGLQCALIAAMGVVLGALSGLVPALGLRFAEYRNDMALAAQGLGNDAELYFSIPWETFAQLIIVVPLVAGLMAALLTRSRTPLARRTG